MPSDANSLVEHAFSLSKYPTQSEELRPFVPNFPQMHSPMHQFTASQVSEMSRLENSSDKHMFVTCIDKDAAPCLTLDKEGSLKTFNTNNGLNHNHLEKSVNVSGWALPPVMPNVVNSHTFSTFPELKDQPKPRNLRTGNCHRRQVFYARHHPRPSNVSCLTTASDVKNKTRFSATGASGIASVVRDSKMSISSSPPSPRAGSLGGSYRRPALNYQNHFTPISVVATSALTSLATTTVVYSPVKKDSAMSTSPTFSSMSSRSSTSSSTGNGSRKRRADEVQRCSGYSSTNEVATAVSNVNIHDRSSTGSVSPTEYMTGQPYKRSKNDNTEDDDVIFVSHEPGPSAKLQAEHGNPFLSPSNIHPAKPSTRRRKKKQNRACQAQNSHSLFAKRPSCSNRTNIAVSEQCNFVNVSIVTTAVTNSGSSKSMASNSHISSNGYFLRSSVNRLVASKNDVQARESSKIPCESNVPTIANNFHSSSRCLTRSQRKRKEDVSTAAVSLSAAVEGTTKCATNEESQDTAKPSFIPSSLATNRRTLPSFKASYDIKGQIGVGGGGIVFAGTRKSDLAEVAIKRVPKEKVRRWGTLNGRNVPLEFELLQRAVRGGNEGVIRMYDWFERSKYYILVMERPQPVIDLFDYLSNYGAMKEDLAKKVFRQIVKAVHNFHANGVVHRDIKDENVLLNLHTHEAKVIDFGCGTYLKEDVYSEFAGTPEFYPPEWFEERKYYGKRVDAWSIGVLLYTMLESEVPFPKEADIVKCQWKFNRTEGVISSSCRQLIESMLQKDQHKRPTIEEVLQHQWLQEDASEMSLSCKNESINQSDGIGNNSNSMCSIPVLQPPSDTSVIYIPSKDSVSNSAASATFLNPLSPSQTSYSETSTGAQDKTSPIVLPSNSSNVTPLSGLPSCSQITSQHSSNLFCAQSSQSKSFADHSPCNSSPIEKSMTLRPFYSKPYVCACASISQSNSCCAYTSSEQCLHSSNSADRSALAVSLPVSPVTHSRGLQADPHTSSMQQHLMQSPLDYQYISSPHQTPSASQRETQYSISKPVSFGLVQPGNQYPGQQSPTAPLPPNYWFLHGALLYPYNNVTPARFCAYQSPAAPGFFPDAQTAVILQGSRNRSHCFPLSS